MRRGTHCFVSLILCVRLAVEHQTVSSRCLLVTKKNVRGENTIYMCLQQQIHVIMYMRMYIYVYGCTYIYICIFMHVYTCT